MNKPSNPPDDIMNQEQFISRLVLTITSATDSFAKDWPGDLLPCDYGEWLIRFQKHCDDSNLFNDLKETEIAN